MQSTAVALALVRCNSDPGCWVAGRTWVPDGNLPKLRGKCYSAIARVYMKESKNNMNYTVINLLCFL